MVVDKSTFEPDGDASKQQDQEKKVMLVRFVLVCGAVSI